ncbi:MAG: PIN domain-containing protein [Hyphomicrobiales bacterium]|nr:PIN domain-containing protein [Hyphomicrobiales bacterium]
MIVPYFLDTKILIYAALPRRGEEWKRKTAADLIDAAVFGTSGQVLQEFYWTATRKGEPPLTEVEAIEWVELVEEQPCVPVDATLIKNGIDISQRYLISYWDGAIVAAARALGVNRIYSEDLNHGQTYDDIRVINPFKDTLQPGGFHEPPQSKLS